MLTVVIQGGGYTDVCCNVFCTFLYFPLSKSFPAKQIIHYNHNKFSVQELLQHPGYPNNRCHLYLGAIFFFLSLRRT